MDSGSNEDIPENLLSNQVSDQLSNQVSDQLLYSQPSRSSGASALALPKFEYKKHFLPIKNRKRKPTSDVHVVSSSLVSSDSIISEKASPEKRLPRFMNFVDTSCPVNDVICDRVRAVLTNMCIADLSDFLAAWKHPHRYYAIINFADACDAYELPYVFAHVQICAFFEHLDELYYSVSNLSLKWQTLKQVGKALFINPMREQEAIFVHVKDNAAEIKDDKLPVSRRLRLELRTAADIVLVGYNALLAKALFTCAWAFSMRICEYSETKPKKEWGNDDTPSHNLRASSIRLSNFGVSASFLSDKTAKYGKCIKHRSISWLKLPEGSREIIEAYKTVRPDAEKFFCLIDGQPLGRTNVENFLDVCLLQTDWKFLKITSHCFRQGRASQEIIEGESLEQLEFDARMTPGGGVFNHYSRSDLATLDPTEIFDDFPKCR